MVIIELVGRILKGRYCILEQIGAGGGGHLYLARDMELGCLWAVKEIPFSEKKEAKLLRLLEHPGMPRMIDYVEKEDRCYLVMEFIRGMSLDQWMKKGRTFSCEEILRYGIEIAGVLKYLHSQKPPIFYGDLKPANLMLTEEGRLCLVDFGSAVVGYTREQGLCTGTRGYAAPEQLQGQMDQVSDVYTLGRTLWALMGKKRLRCLLKMPAMAVVLGRCCAKKPKYRYQDMEAVEKALCRVKKGLGKGRYTVGVSVATALAFVAAGTFMLMSERKPDYWSALTEATSAYYQDGFTGGEERSAICDRVREKLQAMLRQYTDKEEQEYLLLLLEANAEAAKTEESLSVSHQEETGEEADAE